MYEAILVDQSQKCWKVRRFKGLTERGTELRNRDYVECLTWGPANEHEAIGSAIARGSWA